MKTVDLKIFNQNLKINVSEDVKDYYGQIASELNDLMLQEESKSEFLSDVKVAVRVAFMLALENSKLKKSFDKSDEIADRISNKLKLTDI